MEWLKTEPGNVERMSSGVNFFSKNEKQREEEMGVRERVRVCVCEREIIFLIFKKGNLILTRKSYSPAT